MSGPAKITTPRGEVIEVRTKNGTYKTKLVWNPNFASKANTAYSEGQRMMDNEVLRGCSKRVAFRTGMLQKSGTLGTVIGSGTVRWIAPYAQSVYHRNYVGSGGDPQRGGQWFTRWKSAEGKDTIQRIKKKVGGAL